MRSLSRLAAIGLVLGLAACGTGEQTRAPGTMGAYKIGKPYQVNGVWYYPKEDYNYDQTGIASWYGPDFHGKLTADGEPYDMNAETAAHKTLPMPSMVEVTNLENGRRIQVRINDRGPFVPGRIIDLSRRAAEELGMERQGTARVRVRILPEESLALKREAMGGNVVQVASAAPRTPVERGDLRTADPRETTSRTEPAATTAGASGEAVVDRPGGAPVTVVPVKPTGIYVQAGAFAREQNAERLRRELARLGRAQVTVADVHGRHYYRVRLGPVRTVEEGDRLLAHVISTGHTDARIVVD